MPNSILSNGHADMGHLLWSVHFRWGDRSPTNTQKKLTTNKSNVSGKFYSKNLDCMVRESLSKETVFKIRSKWQEGLSHEENGGGRAKVL